MHVDPHSASRAPVAPARQVPLQQFVDEIERMSRSVITKSALEEFMLTTQPDPRELEPYKHWFTEKHTRNKIFRNDMIECMLICWPVGVKTPLHTHNGQLGWMAMVEGKLMV